MIGPAAPDDLDRLVELIELNTGNVIPRGQLPHLEQVASERAREAGFAGLGPYVELLGKSALQQEWRRLLPDVTIKESFLYRIPEHFEALRHDILPSLAKARPKTHGLRVWSAGCARGEEPATLAVVMAECPYLAGREWEVLATDVDDEALDCARRGEHGARAVAQVPAHLLRLHFEPRGAGFRLRRELLERIDFRHFNFFRSPYLGLGPPFDVIFLRNVLIYFSPDAQRRVVARVVSRLAPDGYLFLGHSESLWQLNDEMEPLELDNCFVYRRRVQASPAPARRRPAAARPAPQLRAATPPPPATLPAELPEAAEGPAPDLAAAARALAGDRLDEARAVVDAALCRDRNHAEAHALSGLLHDLTGDAQAAVAAYRAALFLEPALFQVRFMLAHRLEHLGWPARARNEYRQVLTDLGHGKVRTLGVDLPRLLPTPDEASQRSRRALGRL